MFDSLQGGFITFLAEVPRYVYLMYFMTNWMSSVSFNGENPEIP